MGAQLLTLLNDTPQKPQRKRKSPQEKRPTATDFAFPTKSRSFTSPNYEGPIHKLSADPKDTQ